MKLNQTVVRYLVVFAYFHDKACKKLDTKIPLYTHHWETMVRVREEMRRIKFTYGWRKGIHVERVEMHV